MYCVKGRRLAFPWVRLHCLRDYYSMAAVIARFPDVHATFNLTPVLLGQIQGYASEGWTDRALELTLAPYAGLCPDELEEIAVSFFDADWHHEIYPHARYKALFEKRARGEAFAEQEVNDLRMWFNLAWFARDFQTGDVVMPDGTVASVERFIRKAEKFTEGDIGEMVSEQFKVIRNVARIHRELQESGQIEVSTTPHFHPILPLLHDSNEAILDREGAVLPPRIQLPADAEAQVDSAKALHMDLFQRAPVGMWPAEGAVGESVIRYFAKHGIRWIASDAGVLRRSGAHGYEAHRPEILARAWRAGSEQGEVSIFFRDTELSDAIGFQYGNYEPREAAEDFIQRLKRRFAPWDGRDRIVPVILDGENAWGGYETGGRAFLEALYARIAADEDCCSVTFNEYLEGNPSRGIMPHPLDEQPRVESLANASWIDEAGSRNGNDLGTWIGEEQENAAWSLLLQTRQEISGAESKRKKAAMESIYAAEGSDWFWWYGDDQNCDSEPAFDELFRRHLQQACELAKVPVVPALFTPLVPRVVTWAYQEQRQIINVGDRLRFKAGCPGVLSWKTNDARDFNQVELRPAGGVMGGLNIYSTTLPAAEVGTHYLEFSFRCGCAAACRCRPEDLCCDAKHYRVEIQR